MTDSERAVVLHSGGQDSTTCLLLAIEKYGPDNVYPLLINYDQRHGVELACARRVSEELEVPKSNQGYLEIMALSMLEGAALTSMDIEVNTDAEGTGNVYAEDHGLPSTFVPGRNVLFLGLAAAYGAKIGVYELWTGVCETDRAGYPDCRAEFVASMNDTLRLALDEPRLKIEAPLLHASKADTWEIADRMGKRDLIINETHTCYLGERLELHEWGYGCGECGACVERKEGFYKYTAGK